MSAPSPESLELARLWAQFLAVDYNVDLDDADARELARRIDAHVAERVEELTADRDSWEQQASDRVDDALAAIRQRDALRAKVAAADAIVEQCGELIDRLEIRYETPESFTAKARDAIAAYRALSPVGEGQ